MSYHDREANKFYFRNKYGSVTLVRVSDVLPVSNIRWYDVPSECHVSYNDVTKIILITENKHIQPGFEVPLKNDGLWYFMVHVSCSEVVLAKPIDLVYCGPEDSYKEIVRTNQLQDAFERGFFC